MQREANLHTLLVVLLQPLLLWTRLLQVSALQTVTDDDLVLAIGTYEARLPLVWASRSWRGKIRTLVALDDEAAAQKLHKMYATKYLEHYMYWPDSPNNLVTPGDVRVALMPWFAHKKWAGTYKWILMGDDDTVWFTPGLKLELAEYDHTLPYLVTDAFWWWRDLVPPDAPRCLPCHRTAEHIFAHDNTLTAETAVPTDRLHIPPVGCPCTVDMACNYGIKFARARRKGPVTWTEQEIEQFVPYGYPTECEYATVHGGSGVFISAGAMEKVSYDDAMVCMYGNDSDPKLAIKKGTVQEGGRCDKRLSLCFWMHNIAITDPGYTLKPTPARRRLNDHMRLFSSTFAKPEHFEYALEHAVDHSNVWMRFSTVHLGLFRKLLLKKHGGDVAAVIREMALYSQKLGSMYAQLHPHLLQQYNATV